MDRKPYIAAVAALLLILVSTIIAVIALAVQLRDAKKQLDDVESGKKVQLQDAQQEMNDTKSDNQDMTEEPDLTSCDDVAIIGAGISGSYAAWRLRERGWKITLYEYSNRIGGRMHTVNLSGKPGVNVELGFTDHTLFSQTIHALGLEAVDFPLGFGTSSDTAFYLRGQHMTYAELPTNAPYNIPDQYTSRYDFNTFRWHVFDNYTKSDPNVTEVQHIKSIDGIELGNQSIQLFYTKLFDSETVKYVADASSFFSNNNFLNAGNYVPASDPNQTSDPSPVKTVRQGFQAVPKALVEEFLDASNKSIWKHDEKYVLSFQPTETKQGLTKDATNEAPRKTRAKKVALSVRQMALQHLDWPVLKRNDIRDMLDNAVQPVRASKIFFGYNSTWWRNISRAVKHAMSTTPIRQTYDYGKSTGSEKAVLLTSYATGYDEFWRDVQDVDFPVLGDVGGDMSIGMSNTSVYLARKYCAELFNVTVKDVPEPESPVMVIWDSYPIGAAWYNWMPNYYWGEVEKKMLKPSPIDDVYITGNIFSKDKLSGWVEGALVKVETFIAALDETQ